MEFKQLVCKFLKLFIAFLSFMTVRLSVIHEGTAPAFTHTCRYCLSFGCRLVALLNQNPCTESGSAAFQLDILAIVRFSSFRVLVCLSVYLLPSSTTRNLYCASLVQTITFSKTQLIPLALVPVCGHESFLQVLCKTGSDDF